MFAQVIVAGGDGQNQPSLGITSLIPSRRGLRVISRRWASVGRWEAPAGRRPEGWTCAGHSAAERNWNRTLHSHLFGQFGKNLQALVRLGTISFPIKDSFCRSMKGRSMKDTPKKTPHLSLDGKWFPCDPADEFGFLGDRILCDLGSSSDQPGKKLLLRSVHPLQIAASNSRRPLAGELEVEKVPDAAQSGVRPSAVKMYRYAMPSAEGKFKKDEQQFLQQDITGLITLREAILKAVNDGAPRKVWFLFYSACKALNTYGKSLGGQRLVPLQCPNSLAVDARTGQVVMLDAEIKIPALSDSNEAAFVKWFSAAGRKRYAQEVDASLLHSKALLLYFREILGYLDKKGPDAAGIPPSFGVRLDDLATAKSLQELEEKVEEFAEDWSLAADEDKVRVASESANDTMHAARPALQRQDVRSWLGWFVLSFLVNVVLAILLASLLFSSAAQGQKKGPPEDSSLQFSSYCVVFPARGTSSEKVLNALKQLYPGPDKVRVPKLGESAQTELLNEHLDLAAKSIKETDKVKQLLRLLHDSHSIRFNGYSAEADDLGLRQIIANGGLYRVAAAEKVEHGSLLRANSVDRILKASGLEKQPSQRDLLDSLRTATHEYASIKDAVTVIGDRTAYILKVEPTAKAHEAVRMQLVNLDSTSVFIPRPVFELFDAVDPAAGSGGGVARYTLKLDRQCYWRLVSSEDRLKTDYEGNPTNKKMTWLSFAADKEIVWTTLPVLRQTGRTDTLSSFDIAVKVNDGKVVVFRNQSILVGESKDQVVKQARVYVDKVLGIRNIPIEEAVTVRQQEERFTGALLYNYLAEQAKEAHGEDLEIMTSAVFEMTREREDSVLK